MKLEFKKFQHYPRLSEETTAFSADLYVDGVKFADVNNEGRGGQNNINPYNRNWDKLRELEAYCQTLPSKYYDNGKTKSELKMNLDFKLDLMASDCIDAKDFSKKLIYRTKDDVKMEISWKGVTVNTLLKTDTGRKTIKLTYDKLIADGYKILNTNLPF